MSDIIKELEEKVAFLEALLELNTATLDKTLQTNRQLIEKLKELKNQK